MWLGLGIGAAVLVLTSVILGVVFTLVGRAKSEQMARFLEELQGEGVVRTSGRRGVTVRYRDYRRPGYYASSAIQRTTRELVMTKSSFAVVGSRLERCPLAELNRYRVAVDGDLLRIVSDHPIDATGHVDIRVRLDDAAEWSRMLRESGAGLATDS